MTDDENTWGAGLEPDERDPEAPEADAVEQATTADPTEPGDEVPEDTEVHPGLEVNDWDAVEQARIVDLSDEY